jgi:hypothetical protein
VKFRLSTSNGHSTMLDEGLPQDTFFVVGISVKILFVLCFVVFFVLWLLFLCFVF